MTTFFRPAALLTLLCAMLAFAQTVPEGWVLDGSYQRPMLPGESLRTVVEQEYPRLAGRWSEVEQLVQTLNPGLLPTSLRPGQLVRLPVLGPVIPGGEPLQLNLPSGGALAGAVQELIGIVTVTDRNGQRRSARSGDSLWVGDTISTGSGSSARLRLLDGGQVLLRPLTTLQVQVLEFVSAADNNAGRQVVRLFKGGMRAISGLISKHPDSQVQVNTGTAVIGVRGTDYGIRLCEASDCRLEGQVFESGTYTGVISGAVQLANGAGSADMTPGDVFGATGGAPVSRPEAAPLVFLPNELKLLPRKAQPVVEAAPVVRDCFAGYKSVNCPIR